MNPFSKYLRQFAHNPTFDAFVAQWDVVESVVVGVYRGKMPIGTAQERYDDTWPRLRDEYPLWEPTLRPYWQQAKAAGELARQDPFQLILDLPGPQAIPDNWIIMQYLPAAREAINRFLVDSDTMR